MVRPVAPARRRVAAIRWSELAWETLKYALVALVLVALLAPIYWILSSAVKPERDFVVSPPVFLFQPTFANFGRTFADQQFVTYLGNSLIVSGSSTVLTIAVASLAAHALARYEFAGAKL